VFTIVLNKEVKFNMFKIKKVMKRKSFLFCYLLIVSFAFSIGFNSCSDDDSCPEEINEETVFFVSGKVLDGDKALSGVAVRASGEEATTDANGVFQISLTKTGDHIVTFTKEGYITVNSNVEISSTAKSKSNIVLKQSLTKKNPVVKVKAGEAKDIVEPQDEAVVLSVPEDALEKDTDISITKYDEGAKKDHTSSSKNAVQAGLAALNCEPDGTTFKNPVTLSLKNPMEGAVRFGNVKHYVEKNGVWTEGSEVTYDEATHSYKALLNGFSNHSFRVDANQQSTGITRELLDTKVLDNLGKMSAAFTTFTVKQKYGWDVDGSLATMLKTRYPSFSDELIASLVSNITTLVSSMMGSAPGVGEYDLTIPVGVGGDMKLTMKFYAQVNKTTMEIPLIIVVGNSSTLEWFNVPVKKYMGTEAESDIVYGSSWPAHSGGTGQ